MSLLLRVLESNHRPALFVARFRLNQGAESTAAVVKRARYYACSVREVEMSLTLSSYIRRIFCRTKICAKWKKQGSLWAQ